MSTTWLELTCRDAVIARDGRPFGANSGSRMRPTDWPLPSVIAGSLRTALGRVESKPFSVATAIELLEVRVDGFLPLVDDTLYLPAPIDCVPLEGAGQKPLRAVPWKAEDMAATDGADWPAGPELMLRPVSIPLSQAEEDFKPAAGSAWWPIDAFAEWTTGGQVTFDRRFLLGPEVEHRTHVKLDSERGAAEESQLFSTSGLILSALRRFGTRSLGDRDESDHVPVRMAVRVDASGWCADAVQQVNGLHPTGGERRLVHWAVRSAGDVWDCPQVVKDRLRGADRVRMTLVTPAVFREGWLPGWLGADGIGSPPGCDVRLKLVAASIGRWKAVSGWSLIAMDDEGRPVERNGRDRKPDRKPDPKPGPKPIRRIVPSGGVYYFERVDGEAEALADRWLESVSDAVQERRDGFGLAAWGTW